MMVKPTLRRLRWASLYPIIFGIAAIWPIEAAEPASPIHQLRIYEIPAGNAQAFHERFRDHALRIMARHGFDVLATWEARAGDRVEFVYLLEWPDEVTMKERWAGFMADQEWKDIKRDTARVHGVFVEAIEDRTLRTTDYSPRKTFAD